MVQKEVRKKTKIYATVAVLSAIILITLIYSFGSAPTIFPPNQTPFVSGMKTFSSVDELKSYINNATSNGYNGYSGGPLDSKFFGSTAPIPVPASVPQSAGLGFGSTNIASSDAYSTTNIQVAGVDEADTVKTDGQYIYTATSTQANGFYYSSSSLTQSSNSVYIIKAGPQNPQVISKITLGNDTEPAGLYLSQDGNKLVVLASRYQTYSYGNGLMPPISSSRGVAMPMLAPYQADVYTFINVYDVSNKADPVLDRNFTVSGSYFNSRMIGNYVYAVVSQPAAVYDNAVTLPAVYNGETQSSVPPSSIYYSDMVEPSYYTYTSFFGVNILDNTQQPTNMTVMMGGASTMYVSQNNIYVTYPLWTNGGEYTSIYRVSINGAQLTSEAQGMVPGYVINQYAMDENNGYFRVATNWQGQSQTGINTQTSTKVNNLYVLNSNLTTVGKVEGIGQNENLHSVRFIGDRCYLITFKKTDPLFVIDVSQPENPNVLGSLEIPGYSDYLHPYDANHLIGVGKAAVDSTSGDFAWYQGIKLALFDVTNVNNPTQLSNYVIGDRGTDSLALTEPKAFLFDKATGLLVIPVSLALVDNSTGQATASSYGTTVWQGAYVFNVNLNGGFTLKGTITHIDPSLLNAQGYLKDSSNYGSSYYSTQNNWITRALYIGNTLYTFSNVEVKLNSLTDMTQIAEIGLT
jgi:inhibitor of cysteine peptidase